MRLAGAEAFRLPAQTRSRHPRYLDMAARRETFHDVVKVEQAPLFVSQALPLDGLDADCYPIGDRIGNRNHRRITRFTGSAEAV